MPPTFHKTISIEYTDSRGREVGHDVEVTYTFAGGKGDLPVVTEMRSNGFNGYDDGILEERAWVAICDKCDEAYAEWEADQGDYLLEQRRDARMEAEMGL